MASEKQFEEKVKAYLKEQGCWVLKTWSNGIQREGVPDLLVCCNSYFVGIELKAPTGKPTALQLKNIDWIRKASGIAIVLYPDQFKQFKDLIEGLKHNCHYAAFCDQYSQFNRKETNEHKNTDETDDQLPW